MAEYYKQYAEQLLDLGYSPIPIRPKSKIPFFSKGESWQIPVDRKTVQRWAENGKGKGSVAIKDIGAIDCDIRHTAMCKKIIDYLQENVNENIAIRTGQPPKFLVPISPSSAIEHKLKWTWYDKDGEKQEIEILSPGDQYFVAFGEHPNGMEYAWSGGPDLLNRKADSLPVFDELDLAQFEDFFNEEAETLGWTKEGPTKAVPKKVEFIDGDFKVPGKMANAAGVAELKAWLKHLDKHCCDDRDEWIRIGAALHHETGGTNAGWALFDEWSRSSKKYKDRADTLKRWESYQEARGVIGSRCATAGTIVQALKDSGGDVWEKANVEGQEARATISACGVMDDNVEDTGVDDDPVDYAIKKLNEKHAMVSIVGKAKVINFHKDVDDVNDNLDFSSVEDLHHLYANRFVFVGKGKESKKVPITKVWIKHPDRRQYNGIIFEPGATKRQVGNNYNLWQGLAVKPHPGKWDLYKTHVFDIIADGDTEIGEWIIAWIARIIQSPGGERPGTSIVLRGKQGTGKGMFVNVLGKIFGRHFLQVASGGQITGRFNSHLKDKILLFADEGFWAGDKRAEGVIKSIITEPFIPIEQKGIDIIRVKNHLNLIIASNSDWIVPAGLEERRFFVLDVPSHQQQNPHYFKPLYKQMYHDGGIEAMVYDMLHMDISKIDLTKFKKTKALLDQIIFAMDTFQKFWLERLGNGTLSNDIGYGQGAWGRISSPKLYECYQDHVKDVQERYPLSPTQFGIAVRKLFPGVYKLRGSVDQNSGRRERELVFPSLETCKRQFEDLFGGQKIWDETGELISEIKIVDKDGDDDCPF